MRFVAYIWYCGDDYCGCSQPVIQAHHLACRHLAYDGQEAHRVQGNRLWSGTFRTDHEPGAEEELHHTLSAMRDQWPQVYHTTIVLDGEEA